MGQECITGEHEIRVREYECGGILQNEESMTDKQIIQDVLDRCSRALHDKDA